ncbi:MAG TPA: hypothetical protein DEA78_22845 [Cyanobacteria bacterium UBA11159]|nr:hypothetical protein [Cyanobacteria bacterium UBA11366]HBK63664.1 hypothetical protein [Cyanobacteria bacterium UBA11166]HBR76443.1 hypothetical protein [Cyanobacteria bacterium UBA11159]
MEQGVFKRKGGASLHFVITKVGAKVRKEDWEFWGGGTGFEPVTSRLKGDNPNSAAFSGKG